MAFVTTIFWRSRRRNSQRGGDTTSIGLVGCCCCCGIRSSTFAGGGYGYFERRRERFGREHFDGWFPTNRGPRRLELPRPGSFLERTIRITSSTAKGRSAKEAIRRTVARRTHSLSLCCLLLPYVCSMDRHDVSLYYYCIWRDDNGSITANASWVYNNKHLLLDGIHSFDHIHYYYFQMGSFAISDHAFCERQKLAEANRPDYLRRLSARHAFQEAGRPPTSLKMARKDFPLL